jgi:hypothetical protein
VPDKNSFLKFHEWGQQFGAIYQTNLAGQTHVWITRDNVAQELLGKRAANNSERPFIPSLQADNRVSGHYLPLMSRNGTWFLTRAWINLLTTARTVDQTEKVREANHGQVISQCVLQLSWAGVSSSPVRAHDRSIPLQPHFGIFHLESDLQTRMGYCRSFW